MLRLDRPVLAPTLAAKLADRKARVTDETKAKDEWPDFTETEKDTFRALQTSLGAISGGKCMYCDWLEGTQIEHHWPKSPHPTHNAGRGTPRRMYDWDNMLWSCGVCNGWSVKGAHMKWDANDIPLIADPTRPDQDPLGLLEFEVDPASNDFGKVNRRRPLGTSQGERGQYTIKRLKLNERPDLLRERRDRLRQVMTVVSLVDEFGPDKEVPEGQSIGAWMIRLLDRTSPHLGPIRQFFQRDPARWQRLVQQMPELQQITARWNLPEVE